MLGICTYYVNIEKMSMFNKNCIKDILEYTIRDDLVIIHNTYTPTDYKISAKKNKRNIFN